MSRGTQGLLVPVDETVTLRNTVTSVVREADRRAARTGEAVEVHFVYPVAERDGDTGDGDGRREEELLDQITEWAHEDLSTDAEPSSEDAITVRTAAVGASRRLGDPGDYAELFAEYARDNDLGHVVLDPEYESTEDGDGRESLRVELRLADINVREAPTGQPTRRPVLVRQGDRVGQFLSVFAFSYAFYLALAGLGGNVDLVGGALVGVAPAAVTAGLLSRIVVNEPFSPVRVTGILLRFGLFLPYFLAKVVRTNLEIAYVTLHPRFPIDPAFVEFEVGLRGDVPITILANSLTLTPGTVTVDVTDDEFEVHTLYESARRELTEASLERAVAFVFGGRTDEAEIPRLTDADGGEREGDER